MSRDRCPGTRHHPPAFYLKRLCRPSSRLVGFILLVSEAVGCRALWEDRHVAEIACPSCGEAERLRGRRAGDAIQVECEACGARWERDIRPRCRLCGSEDLRYTPEPLWERGRGDQRTPAGRRDAWACNECGGRNVTSAGARPGEAR